MHPLLKKVLDPPLTYQYYGFKSKSNVGIKEYQNYAGGRGQLGRRSYVTFLSTSHLKFPDALPPPPPPKNDQGNVGPFTS